MHTDKQRIFDDHAKSEDFESIKLGDEHLEIEDFDDLLLAFRYSNISLPSIKQAIFEACDLVQQEQQKRISGIINYDDDEEAYWVSKKEIINPKNIIS